MAKKKKEKDSKCFYLPEEAGEALDLATETRSLYQNRDRRMLDDERAYQMYHKPPKAGEVRQLLNDSPVQVDAANDLMATVAMQIQVATDENTAVTIAQDAEDLLRYVWQEWQQRYARQGRPPLIWDMCNSLNLYGWLVPRLLLNPEDRTLPVSLELLDPRRVYPDRPDGQPDCIYYFTQSTPAQIARRFGEKVLQQALPDIAADDRHPVALVHYHTDHELAISVGTEWLKPPTAHDYGGINPVQIFMASGSTFRGPSPLATWSDTADITVDNWDEHVGTGFLQTIRPIVEDAQKIATLRAQLLAQSANPVVIAKLRTTELETVPSGPGANAKLTPDEGYEQHPPPPQALQFAMQMAQERAYQVQQGGINAALLGGGEAQAGIDRFLLSSAGARRLRPRVTVFQLVLSTLFESVLRLYATYGGPAMRYVRHDRDTGVPTIAARLRPSMLRLADLRVEVQLGEIGVPDQQQRMTMASMGVREGLISQEYALTELLRVTDPSKVMAQTRKDQVWKVPQVVEAMALWETAQDPRLGPLQLAAQAALPASMQRLLELAQPPQPPGPAPGQMAGPGAQGPPLPGSGLPSTPQPGVPPEVMPPAMQQMGAPPNSPLPPGMMPPGAGLPR